MDYADLKLREPIKFTVQEGEVFTEVETFENEYRNLMVLISDKFFPEYFGECGGQGRCATCTMIVEENMPLPIKSRNEEETLIKNAATNNKRLSCQILITQNINGAVFCFPED